MDTQGRVGLAGELLAEFDADILLADLDQLAEVFPAAAVEQLHGVARGVPQHAADVVGLGLGQVVLAEERGWSTKKRDRRMAIRG